MAYNINARRRALILDSGIMGQPSFPDAQLPGYDMGSLLGTTQPQGPAFPSMYPVTTGLMGQPQPGPQQAPVEDQSTMADNTSIAGAQAAMRQDHPTLDSRMMGLLNSPTFQLGMNLMGSQHTLNPWGSALNSTLDAQQQMGAAQRAQEQLALQQQQADTQKPLIQAQTGLTQAQTGSTTATTDMERQKLGITQQQWRAQQGIMGAIAKKFGYGGLFGQQTPDAGAAPPQAGAYPPQQAAPPPTFQPQGYAPPAQRPAPSDASQPGSPVADSLPQGGAGTYGTPNWMLDKISAVESNGNPNAVNAQSGAQGAYQFMPGTVQMLGQQGHPFDPMNPGQARDAADFYLQTLLKKNGGDWQKTLADYGGFKKKDPTPYVSKILTGAPQAGSQQGAAPAQPATAPQPNDGMEMAQLGMLGGMVNMPGAAGMIEYGKMQQPQPVQAGSYMRDPQTGNLTFNPDPYKEGEAKRAAASQAYETGTSPVPGMSPKDVSQMKGTSLTRQVEDITKAYDDKISLIPGQYEALNVAKANLAGANPFIGTFGEKKLEMTKFFNNNFAWLGVSIDPGSVRSAEELRSALGRQIVAGLKQMDAQPSEGQQKMLMSFLGNLNTDPRALPGIIDLSQQIMRDNVDRHNKRFNEAKAAGAPFVADLTVTLPPPPKSAAAPAPALAPQVTAPVFSRASPRETSGKIRPGGVKFLGFEQ